MGSYHNEVGENARCSAIDFIAVRLEKIDSCADRCHPSAPSRARQGRPGSGANPSMDGRAVLKRSGRARRVPAAPTENQNGHSGGTGFSVGTNPGGRAWSPAVSSASIRDLGRDTWIFKDSFRISRFDRWPVIPLFGVGIAARSRASNRVENAGENLGIVFIESHRRLGPDFRIELDARRGDIQMGAAEPGLRLAADHVPRTS